MPQPIKLNSGSTSPLYSRRVTLAASAASGALTASRETLNWGQAGAGTISITVAARSNLQIAPDSVRCTVDLSSATFDTAAQWTHPGGALGANAGTAGDLADSNYDARLHDLLFFWDVSGVAAEEARRYQHTTNVLDHWKNPNWGQGPLFGHCFKYDGTHTVGVIVIEPSSGKFASATTEIVVGDADSAYPTTQTICVYPDGGSAGTTPTGAQTVDDSGFLALWNALSDANPIRVLWQRGGTYTNSGNIRLWPDRPDRAGPPNCYFGAYGNEADPKPILAPPFQQFQFSEYGLTTQTDWRITGLDVTGGFDIDSPTTVDWGTDTDTRPAGIGLSFFGKAAEDTKLYAVWQDVTIRQFWGGDGAGIMDYQDTLADARVYFHIDDCNFDDFRGKYVILTASQLGRDNTWLFTGNSFVGRETMPVNSDFSEAVYRLTMWAHCYIAKNDCFTPSNTNALTKVENAPDNYSLVDFSGDAAQCEASGPWTHGNLINIHANTFEGQVTLITINRTAKHGGGVQNMIIDGNIFISGPSTEEMIEVGGQGVTCRNNFMYVPDVQRLNTTFKRFFAAARFTYPKNSSTYWITDTLASTGSSYTWYTRPFPGMAPIRFYNNTLVFARSDANNNSEAPVDMFIEVVGNDTSGLSGDQLNGLENYTLFEAVFSENNVLHMPNFGADISGVDTSNLLPFRPRFAGTAFWDNGTKDYTAIQADDPRDMTAIDIATFAAPLSLTGTSLSGVTSHTIALGDVWSYADPDANIKAPTGVKGAWLNGATPT